MTVPSNPISADELAELEKASEIEATEEIELETDDEEYPEVEETEVTADNFKDFLPKKSADKHTFSLDDAGKLSEGDQSLYDEPEPEIQASYEKGHGL